MKKSQSKKKKSSHTKGHSKGGLKEVLVTHPTVTKDGPSSRDLAMLSLYAYKALSVGEGGKDPVRTVYEKWESTIVAHLCSRQKYFGLPSINTDNGLFGNLSKSSMDANPIFPSNVDASAETFGYVANQNGLNRKSNLQGRYSYQTGLINNSVSLSVGPNSSAFWVGFFRPDQINAPFILLNSADVISATSQVAYIDWTENPFFGAVNFSTSSISAPSIKVKTKAKKDDEVVSLSTNLGEEFGPASTNGHCLDMLQFTGGYEIEIDHINKTAYTSTAFKLRTSSNTIHDFMQLYDNLTSDSINLGTESGFTDASSIYMATSGTRWSTINRYQNVSYPTFSPGYPDSGLCVLSLETAILNDWPVFQVCITNSGPDVASIVLNVKVQGWHGTAPTTLQYAGSMPFQTVPFVEPAWVESCKTVGLVKKAKGKDDIFRPLVSAMSTSLSRSTALAIEHPKTLSLIAGSPSVRGLITVPPNRAANIQPQESFGGKVAKTIQNGALEVLEEKAKGAVESLLSSLGHAVGSGFRNLFSSKTGNVLRTIGNTAAQDAPLLLEALAV